jgi:hypothetical protein
MAKKMVEALQGLHADCVRALRSYIAEANQTCKLLTNVKSFPLPVDQQMAIPEQRRKENAAHERYQEARRQLFAAAKWE